MKHSVSLFEAGEVQNYFLAFENGNESLIYDLVLPQHIFYAFYLLLGLHTANEDAGAFWFSHIL